ncbi:MAG TPA: SDR family oxidoreductase [Solirubrobacteraceae bacterium]|nr:SDR family oxidoreductase [Solirubrobacteraceae bacterium]
MRVFVTGASGHIGSAVVPELVQAGHEVVGLARSDESAAKVAEWGGSVVRGDLDDLDVLREAAADADGVIHLAFRHDLMQTGDMDRAAEVDLAAIRAMYEPLIGTDKAFVGTSGTGVLAMAADLGRPGTEEDTLPGGYRIDGENELISLADRGVRTSLVRLPPTVHSHLDKHGFIPTLIGLARANGRAGYPGDGANCWPAVHTLDAARLYRLAVEAAPAGTRLHAVADEGVPMREIAEAIGRNLDVPVQSISPEEDDAQFGFLTAFVGLDNPTSAAQTRALMAWEPSHPGLIADMDEGHYFA